MPKAKRKSYRRTIPGQDDNWGSDEFRALVSEQLESNLGLKRKKKTDTVWYYPGRNPVTGLIPHTSKERVRSHKKAQQNEGPAVTSQDNAGTAFDAIAFEVMQDVSSVEEACQSHSSHHAEPALALDEDTVDTLLKDLQASLGIAVNKEVAPSWKERQVNAEESWKDARPKILQFLFQKETPLTGEKCEVCQHVPCDLKCVDCRKFMCTKCDEIIHRDAFLHDRTGWKDGYFSRLPISSCFPVPDFIKCRQCNKEDPPVTRVAGSYIAVTLRGRRCIPRKELSCRHCGSVFRDVLEEISTLLKNEFWPGSVCHVTYIFSFDVLNLVDVFMKNMPGTSLASIAKAFQDVDESDQPINKTVLSRALTEFRFSRHALKKMEGHRPMQCPACHHSQHSAHVDGNFKVYRYSKVPRGIRRPYYEGIFIVPNEAVARHMTRLKESDAVSQPKELNNCGTTEWRAARSSARPRSKLDECGLEVVGCRHSVAQKAVNMFTGEQYGFPHYLHINFCLPKNIKFLWQDVICRYWPWAKKQSCIIKDEQFLKAVKHMKPALSVMHAKAHDWACQVLWGGRNQPGAGAGAGEEMEQFFSYLSRLGSTTKNMSADAREDTITEHVFFWNERKSRNMALLLSKRYVKTMADKNACAEELTSTVNLLSCDVTVRTLQKWHEEMKNHAKGIGFEADVGEESSDTQRRRLEAEIEHRSLSMRLRKIAVSKMADTSKQRVKLRRKNEVERLKIKDLLDKLAEVTGGTIHSVESVVDGIFPWHSHTAGGEGAVPWDKRKKMVDLFILQQRLEEEEKLLKKEMRNVLLYYQDIIASLQEEKRSMIQGRRWPNMEIESRHVSSSADKEQTGMIALKEKGIQKATSLLSAAVVLFTKTLGSQLDLDSFSDDSETESDEE